MEVSTEDAEILSDKSSSFYDRPAATALNQQGGGDLGYSGKAVDGDHDKEVYHPEQPSHHVVYVENDCNMYLTSEEKVKVNLVSDMGYIRDLMAAVWQARIHHIYTDLVFVCQDGQVAAHSFLLAKLFDFCDVSFNLEEHSQLIFLPDCSQKEVEIAVKDVYCRASYNRLCQLLNISQKCDPPLANDPKLDSQFDIKHEEPKDRSKIAVKQIDELMEAEEKYSVMTLLDDFLKTEQKLPKKSKKVKQPKTKKSTKEQSNKKKYDCKECSYSARTKALLSNHSKKHKSEHSNVETKKLPTIKEKRRYKCNHCDFVAKTVRELTKHTTYNHKDIPKKYKCDKCNFATNYFGNVEKHMKKMHLNIPGEYACPQCPSTFYVLAKLKSHMVIHSEEKNFVCDECAAKFKRKDDLKCHMKIHLPDEIRLVEKAKRLTKECPTCHKMFEKKWKLQRHQKVHQKDNLVTFVERSQVPMRWEGGSKPVVDITGSNVRVEEIVGEGDHHLPAPVQEFIVLTTEDRMVQHTGPVNNRPLHMDTPEQKMLLANSAKYDPTNTTSNPITF